MTQTVFNQIMSIRSGGTINMLDVNGVQRIAYENKFYDLVIYIEDDKSRYFHFIMTGELPEGEENPACLSDAHKEEGSIAGVDNTLSDNHNGVACVDDTLYDNHTGEKGGDAL